MSLSTKIFKLVHCDTRVFVSIHPFDTQCRQRRISKFSALKICEKKKKCHLKKNLSLWVRWPWQQLIINEKVRGYMNVCCSIQKKMFINIQKCFLRFLFLSPPLNFIFSFTNRRIRLTQCCTQFKSPGDKFLCVLHLHYNVAFIFKWYGNSWNKTFYSQRVWIGYNIELAE